MATLRQVLKRTHQNLQILREREAKYGGNTPLELLNQIRDHVQAIALTKQAIAGALSEVEWREAMQPLLVAIQDRAATSEICQVSIGDIAGGIYNSVIAGRDVHITFVQGAAPSKIEEKPLLPFEPKTILIPAGPFIMGSATGEVIEQPQHTLTLPAFKIGQYPVTNAQYAEFIKREKRQKAPAHWSLRQPPADKLDHPVVGVSWDEAQAYCHWLSQLETGRSYRLPTEAEWEKAARGADGRVYPWGNNWEEGRCNAVSHDTTTTPVLIRTPDGVQPYYPQGNSPYGCSDMSGNAQEWTGTLWGDDPRKSKFPYPYASADGREDPEADQHLPHVFRIHRGGSFRDRPSKLTCSARGYAHSKDKSDERGFRLVLEI